MRDISSNSLQGKESCFPLKMALDGAIFVFKIRRVILNLLDWQASRSIQLTGMETAMASENFRLILDRSDEDEPISSESYQNELLNFANQANISGRRRQVNDSLSGGGWELGEFLFNNADSIIEALGLLGAAWISRCPGRKLRLKFGDIELEANKQEDIDAMVKQIERLQRKKEDDAT